MRLFWNTCSIVSVFFVEWKTLSTSVFNSRNRWFCAIAIDLLNFILLIFTVLDVGLTLVGLELFPNFALELRIQLTLWDWIWGFTLSRLVIEPNWMIIEWTFVTFSFKCDFFQSNRVSSDICRIHIAKNENYRFLRSVDSNISDYLIFSRA